jgi:hypothetical protein
MTDDFSLLTACTIQDIPRTTECIGETQSESLRRVLQCYSIRNPPLGYCQSMNFLAAEILQVISCLIVSAAATLPEGCMVATGRRAWVLAARCHHRGCMHWIL